MENLAVHRAKHLYSGVRVGLYAEHVFGHPWGRLARRALKLAGLALLISLVTRFVIPDKFVRFGVLHFFALTILLAPLFKILGYANIVVGSGVIGFYQWMGKPGLYPELRLYITDMMSERPKSMDYVPLTPWFGVFLLGLGAEGFIVRLKQRDLPPTWANPVIWLGRHSLSFYFIHQAVLFGLFSFANWLWP